MGKAQIIITGGLGYIGSHCVVELEKAGYETIILDNLSNTRLSVLDGLEDILGKIPIFHELDITDKELLESTLRPYDNIQGVIHFAAYKAVGESVREPLKYYNNNINGLVNMLDLCGKRSISNFIFSSSCTVYGETKELPVTEASPLNKTGSPYGVTKQLGETIISDYCTAQDAFKAISLRYFNPIGAHPSSKIGELPLGKPENLMPFITQTAIGIREQLSVFGGDYNTPDGTAIRDYIHVCDLANAHLTALERLIQNEHKSRHEFFNLGSGSGYSVLEVIESFERSTGEKLNYKIVDRRPGDAEAIYADTSLSKTELKWEAQYSLDDMTSSAWAWQKKLSE